MGYILDSFSFLKDLRRDKELSRLIRQKAFFLAAASKPKMQAKILDNLFFPNKNSIEEKLIADNPHFSQHDYKKNKKYDESQVWIGLHPQNLETPYLEFLRLFEFLKINNFKINDICDIGSAYGRAGIVAQAVYPKSTFTGFEIVKERALESNKTYKRLKLHRSKTICSNIKDGNIPAANLYIIYDFSHLEDIYFLIQRLIKEQKKRNILIAATGDQTPKIIEKSFPDLFAVSCPIHSSQWNLYSNYGWS